MVEGAKKEIKKCTLLGWTHWGRWMSTQHHTVPNQASPCVIIEAEIQGLFGAKLPTSWWNLQFSLKAGLSLLISGLRVLVAGGSKCLSGLSLQRVGQPSRLWTQLGLDVAAPPSPGYTLAHFLTFILNKKGLKVDYRGFTNKIAKDKMLLGRQDSWLLLPAVRSPSSYIAGAMIFDLFTLHTCLE